MIIVRLLLGFGLLLAGGELLVRGSVGLVLKLRVSRVVIGLTLVAFATSAPELLVSVVAAIDGRSNIALGNVIGSNIANIGLILGLTAIFYKIQAVQITYKKDWIFLLVANVLLGLFLWSGGLQFWQGLIFVLLLIGYNVEKIRGARKNRERNNGDDIEAIPIITGLIFLVAGAGALRFGAIQFVEGIASAASLLGMSERFISVTLVSFGTSMPELAASIIAARKGESGIAIGNIIGSNIFNILSVLGFTALIQPITSYDRALFTFDFWVSVGLSLLIIPLMGWFTKNKLDRLEGVLLLGIYLIFITSLLLLGVY